MGESPAISGGAWFGIGIGAVVVIAIVGWLIGRYIDKRKIQRHQKLKEVDAVKGKDGDALSTRELGMKDLEAGYSKSAGQSRPSSPAPSYFLSPSTTVVNWTDKGSFASHSASSSLTDISGIANPSRALVGGQKHKPSPLRTEPFDRSFHGHLHQNASASSVGGIGGAYMPPLPSPLSMRSVSPSGSTRSKTWVSPLDVHFSRPTTPTVSSRPISYLPRLNFPENLLDQTGLLTPPPSASFSGAKSGVESTFGSGTSQSHKGAEPQAKSPTSTPSNPFEPSRGRSTSGSIFHRDDELPERPLTAENAYDQHGPISTLPQIFNLANDPDLFPEDDLPWKSENSERAVIRDSIVSKQHVSIFEPLNYSRDLPGSPKSHSYARSVVALSICSPEAPAHEHTRSNLNHTRIHSRSQSSENRSHSPSTSRSTSHVHPRSTSVHSVTETRNSPRQHSGRISMGREHDEQQRSRGGDQMHHDNRSGSVQGLAVDFDFDYPLESPFSNSHAVPFSMHSKSSSYSSLGSATHTVGMNKTHKKHQQPSQLASLAPPTIIDKDRLSVANSLAIDKERLSIAMSLARVRSASDASQSSIGDFYDAYYRQSIAAQRASSTSTQSQTLSQIRMSRSGSESLVVGKYESGQWPIAEAAGAARRQAPPPPGRREAMVNPEFHLPFGKRRPPVLDLGPLSGGLGVSRTISGLPSPGPSSESPVIGRYASNFYNPL
ncbi:uncharacterized protein BP5553_01597 [Venustampulla echinocandica]|uniref:Uncharacterized protein n=1 Tax=Venustampulla echinocandica TaxID=2656787 RepID=A0A370U1H1_9HELO|nr:uncharacterized protein BP5553_01597 [Venustampulla echinocandica]RDL41618.1 hypothetical protein BP5553_01597 [Venustampulla echinocandica]